MTDPVVVVGGGISGFAAAGALAEAGAGPVWLLDQGLRLGGRMAARTLRDTGTTADEHVVDWGASYLTVDDPAFAAVVSDWEVRGLARPWTDTFHTAGPEGLRTTTTGPLRWATRAGLRTLVEDLAVDADIRGVTVVHPHDVVRVRPGRPGPRVDGDVTRAVALAMPAPQALRLLSPADPALGRLRARLVDDAWEPVLALVAVYERRCWPVIDGVFVHDSDALTWIADDGRRRGDDAAVLVAHSTSALAARYLDDPVAATAELVTALSGVLGLTDVPRWTAVKRWRFARPVVSQPETALYDEAVHIGLAGDGWNGAARVQSAWISGRALGTSIAADVLGAGAGLR